MKCPRCHRENTGKNKNCLYCGTPLRPDRKKAKRSRLIAIPAAICSASAVVIIVCSVILLGDNSSKVRDQIVLGYRALKEENYEQAEVCFKQALELGGEDPSPEAQVGMAEALQNQNRPEEAKTYLLQAQTNHAPIPANVVDYYNDAAIVVALPTITPAPTPGAAVPPVQPVQASPTPVPQVTQSTPDGETEPTPGPETPTEPSTTESPEPEIPENPTGTPTDFGPVPVEGGDPPAVGGEMPEEEDSEGEPEEENPGEEPEEENSGEMPEEENSGEVPENDNSEEEPVNVNFGEVPGGGPEEITPETEDTPAAGEGTENFENGEGGSEEPAEIQNGEEGSEEPAEIQNGEHTPEEPDPTQFETVVDSGWETYTPENINESGQPTDPNYTDPGTEQQVEWIVDPEGSGQPVDPVTLKPVDLIGQQTEQNPEQQGDAESTQTPEQQDGAESTQTPTDETALLTEKAASFPATFTGTSGDAAAANGVITTKIVDIAGSKKLVVVNMNAGAVTFDLYAVQNGEVVKTGSGSGQGAFGNASDMYNASQVVFSTSAGIGIASAHSGRTDGSMCTVNFWTVDPAGNTASSVNASWNSGSDIGMFRGQLGPAGLNGNWAALPEQDGAANPLTGGIAGVEPGTSDIAVATAGGAAGNMTISAMPK